MLASLNRTKVFRELSNKPSEWLEFTEESHNAKLLKDFSGKYRKIIAEAKKEIKEEK